MCIFSIWGCDLHYPGSKPQCWLHPEYVLGVEWDMEKMSEQSFLIPCWIQGRLLVLLSFVVILCFKCLTPVRMDETPNWWETLYWSFRVSSAFQFYLNSPFLYFFLFFLLCLLLGSPFPGSFLLTFLTGKVDFLPSLTSLGGLSEDEIQWTELFVLKAPAN